MLGRVTHLRVHREVCFGVSALYMSRSGGYACWGHAVGVGGPVQGQWAEWVYVRAVCVRAVCVRLGGRVGA